MTVCSREKCTRVVHRLGLCDAHHGIHPHGYMPTDTVREHLTELRGRGYGLYRLADLTGISHKTLTDVHRGRYPIVHRTTHDAILRVPIPPRVVAEGGLVDVTGTRRRIQALSAIGHSQAAVARRCGVAVQDVNRLTRRQRYVTAEWAVRIAVLFDELQLTVGDSDQARRTAAANRWAPPLAWDEDTIDDPTAKPHSPRAERGGPRFVDRYRDVRHHKGITDCDQIAEALGISTKSLYRELARHREAIA